MIPLVFTVEEVDPFPEKDETKPVYNPSYSPTQFVGEEGEKKITELVEIRLREAQKNKQYQDAGRTTGTKKEKRAYRFITTDVLTDIELEDSILAYKLVTKEKVWQEVNIDAEKQGGTGSGATYLKVQYQKALAKQPYNSKEARAIYVKVIELFKEMLTKAKTFVEVRETAYLIFRSQLETIAPEIKEAPIQAAKKAGRGFYFQSTSSRTKADLIFGKAFMNLVCQSWDSSAAQEKFKAAQLYDAVSPEAEAAYKQEMIIRQNKRAEGYREEIERIKKFDLERVTRDVRYYYSFITKEDIKKDPETYRQKLIDLQESRIKRETSRDTVPDLYRARQENWTWAYETKERKTGEKSTLPRINTYEYLSHIVRKGGIKVDQIGTKGVKEYWGLKAVQYGNSLKDAEAEKLTLFLNGSFADMEEALGMDVKKINQAHGLTLDFATRGTSGSAATYWSNYKVINLNKRNGDGSLGHEYGHYIDNLLARIIPATDEVKVNGQLGAFATENKAANAYINDILEEWWRYVRHGNGTETRDKTYKAGRKVYSFAKVGETAQECINYYQNKHARQFEPNTKSYEILCGQVLTMYGLEEAVIKVPLRSSFLYADSNFFNGQGGKAGYWTSRVEMFARSFEVYLQHKLDAKGLTNNFLQSAKVEYYKRNWGVAPYAQGADAVKIIEIFERLFAAIKDSYQAQSTMQFTGTRVNEEIVNTTLGTEKKATESPIEESREVAAEETKEVITEVVTEAAPAEDKTKRLRLAKAKAAGLKLKLELLNTAA